MFPVCEWIAQVVPCESTESSTTLDSTSTEITTTSSTWHDDLVCPELNPPSNGTLFCNSDNSTCKVKCDQGTVPWQLKHSHHTCAESTRCDPLTAEWTNVLTDECLSIEDVCTLDSMSSMTDPLYTVPTYNYRENSQCRHLSWKNTLNTGLSSAIWH